LAVTHLASEAKPDIARSAVLPEAMSAIGTAPIDFCVMVTNGSITTAPSMLPRCRAGPMSGNGIGTHLIVATSTPLACSTDISARSEIEPVLVTAIFFPPASSGFLRLPFGAATRTP
jgi:hypothetical protein